MPYKYSTYKAFYYRSWPWLLGLIFGALLVLFYLSCNRRPSSLYQVIFNTSPASSVRFYHSQDIYLFDCCLWLHYTIDSSDFNASIKDGFVMEKAEITGLSSVPPEARDWWHPEKLGSDMLFYGKETDSCTIGVYTNKNKTEAYTRYYIK